MIAPVMGSVIAVVTLECVSDVAELIVPPSRGARAESGGTYAGGGPCAENRCGNGGCGGAC